MKHLSRIALPCLVVLTVCSCKDNSVNTDSIPNLIGNSSFELKGQPSLEGWIIDTTLAKVAHDAPVGGGNWSLGLEPGWYPQDGFAHTYITNHQGSGWYNLGAWMRSTNHWIGSVSFGKWSGGVLAYAKSITSDSSEWHYVALIDSVPLQPNDSLAVELSAGSTELANGFVFFDLISLQRLR